MIEKNGSIIEAMLQERNDLLNDADINLITWGVQKVRTLNWIMHFVSREVTKTIIFMVMLTIFKLKWVHLMFYLMSTDFWVSNYIEEILRHSWRSVPHVWMAI